MRDLLLMLLMLVMPLAMTPPANTPTDNFTKGGKSVKLPRPRLDGEVSVAETIERRRSIRTFTDESLTTQQIAQLCWAAQGITDPREGGRAAPSAGGLYPLRVLVVTAAGVFEYHPKPHELRRVVAGDVREALRDAALDQSAVGEAPLCLAIVMDVSTTARKYGDRAERYCLLESGHAAQNVLLQATAMGLGGVPIGAFEDEVAAILHVPGRRRVVYLLPVGHPAKGAGLRKGSDT